VTHEVARPVLRREGIDGDTRIRRLAAYLLVRVGSWSIQRGLGLLPREHPYRILHGSVHDSLVARVSQLPRWGILPLTAQGQRRRKALRALLGLLDA